MSKLFLSVFYYILSVGCYSIELTPKIATEIFLENNFDIKVFKSKINQKEGEELKANAEFDTQISAKYAYDYKETPRATALDTAGNAKAVKSTTKEHEIKAQKKFKTGTNLTVPYKYNIVDSDSSFRVMKVSHEPSLSFTLTQGLIKPFHPGYSTKDIDNAESARLSQIEKTNADIVNKTLKLIESYLDLYEKSKQLELYKTSLESAQKGHEYSLHKRQLGKGSLIDELESQSNLRKAEEKVLSQNLALENAKLELGQQIFAEANKNFSIKSEIEVPNIPNLPEDITPLFESAKRDRFESKQNQLDLQMNINKNRLAQVDKLPDLDLEVKYESKGLNRSLSEANQDVMDRSYPTWRGSITAKRPVFQYAAEGQINITQETLQQTELEKSQTEQEIYFEIMSSVRAIKQEQKILKAMEIGRSADHTKLEFSQKMFYAGQLSFLDLRKAIEAYERSELEMIKSKVRLCKSWYKLQKGQGKLLTSI